MIHRGGRCLCLPTDLGIVFLPEVLKGISTVLQGNPFLINNINEVFFMNIETVKNVPVVFTSVGSCGVALLRSPWWFTPRVLRNSVRSERGYSPRATLRGSIPLPRTFSQSIAITLAPRN
jgi:hypothetical protein